MAKVTKAEQARKADLARATRAGWNTDKWAAAIGETRICPDCGRPQHYTGIEAGWSHDAGWYHDDLVDTWHCADPRKAGA